MLSLTYARTVRYVYTRTLYINTAICWLLFQQCIINRRRACAARVGLCVCLFVYDYSRTAGYEAAYERYKQLQCYKGIKIICGDFAETTAFERYYV